MKKITIAVAGIILTSAACQSMANRSALKGDEPSETGEAQVAPHQVARFTPWLDIIRASIEGATIEEATLNLLEGSNRVAAFNVQALGILYSDQDPMFETLRVKFKHLEDAIGKFDKWKTIFDKTQATGGATPEVLASLQMRRDQAQLSVQDLLTADQYFPPEGALPFLDQVVQQLNAFHWPDYETDKRSMIARLAASLDEIQNAQYDFHFLEHGDGLHEFRRKIRWFTIEARVLNGMVLFKPEPTTCPVAEYAALVHQPIASSKYAKLPGAPTETNPVFISQCLFVELAKMVNDIGDLKDQAELENNQSGTPTDDVSPETFVTITDIYQKMMATNLLPLLRAELLAN